MVPEDSQIGWLFRPLYLRIQSRPLSHRLGQRGMPVGNRRCQLRGRRHIGFFQQPDERGR